MNTTEFKIPPMTYGITAGMSEIVQSIDWQQKAIDDIIAKFTNGKKGVVLRGGTGLGKMYICAQVIRQMHERGLVVAPENSVFPFLALWLCPKSIKTQTLRTLKECGIAHLVMVMTYGQLKSSDGTQMFLSYKTELVGGQPVIIPEWNPLMKPWAIVCDEIQVLKNPESLQSKTVRYAPEESLWLGASATPWQRVADARTTVERCKVVTQYNALPATRNTAPAILREIASPKSPVEYSPSAAKRLRDALEDYIVELKGVRFKYQTKTTFEPIHFKSVDQRRAYEFAYQEYLEELRKKGQSKSHGSMAILVAMQKFQQKAEWLRCDQLAERTMQRVREGKQVIVGSNYVETCRQVWRFLQKFGFDMSRVVFVVGGQKEDERQKMIDKFQAGEADVILLTVRSGGVGLSLHHDRPSTRPRHVIIPIPWSAIDLVQFLGRGHRLTSMSHTTQESLYYLDTIESNKVVPVLQNKVKCLSKTVTAKEQFTTLFEPDNNDVNEEESEAINTAIFQQREAEAKSSEDPDKANSNDDESIGYEGLESVETLPISYR